MTRTLPWQRRASSSTASKKAIPSLASRVKRPGSVDPDPRLDGNAERSETLKHASTKSRASRTSTSPARPMESPLESFMKDGMENDDVFRMVEDEFLDAAKQFTQHLHAAEYQRMKIAAKHQNAETISSISRPVSTRMPEGTRRKAESIALAKKQASVLRGLFGKLEKALESEDSSEEVPAPWPGTALCGLMNSPCKLSASLPKLGGTQIATRAAAGFQRPFVSKNSHKSHLLSQKLGNRPISNAKTSSNKRADDTASADGSDDDLDAPLHPPRFTTSRVLSSSLAVPTTSTNAHIAPYLNKDTSSRWAEADGQSIFPKGFVEVIDTDPISNQAALESKARIARRLEEAHQKKINERKKPRKIVDDIPMFLL